MTDSLDWVDLPVPPPAKGQTRPFSAAGLELLVCNAEGVLYVLQDRCPHARTSLSDGALSGTTLECPLHGGQLDVRDGSPVAMPIRRPATCYQVRAEGERWQVALPSGS